MLWLKLYLIITLKKIKLSGQMCTQKAKRLNLKQAKIMPKNIEDKEGKGWELSIGLYPGILLGIRSYINENYNEHVVYLPFVDICLIVDK